MLETESLILDKAKFSDWKEMYCNVWSQPESAKYMEWNITTSEENAKIRIMKTIAFQKEHDTYLVHRIIINWLYLHLILCQPIQLPPDLFHRACMSNGKLPALC